MSIEESLASLVASLKSGASFESIISVCSDCNVNGDARKAYNKPINAESILQWFDSRLSESTIESSLDSSFKNAKNTKNTKNYKNAKKQKDIRKIAQSLMSVYKLSNSIGCPMADCVQAVADSYYANKRVDELSAEVFAMPKATIKLLIALPFLSLLTGQLLGANPILMIFTSYKGYTLLSVGMAFYAVGVIWVARILKNSRNAMQSASFNGN